MAASTPPGHFSPLLPLTRPCSSPPHFHMNAIRTRSYFRACLPAHLLPQVGGSRSAAPTSQFVSCAGTVFARSRRQRQQRGEANRKERLLLFRSISDAGQDLRPDLASERFLRFLFHRTFLASQCPVPIAPYVLLLNPVSDVLGGASLAPRPRHRPISTTQRHQTRLS